MSQTWAKQGINDYVGKREHAERGTINKTYHTALKERLGRRIQIEMTAKSTRGEVKKQARAREKFWSSVHHIRGLYKDIPHCFQGELGSSSTCLMQKP